MKKLILIVLLLSFVGFAGTEHTIYNDGESTNGTLYAMTKNTAARRIWMDTNGNLYALYFRDGLTPGRAYSTNGGVSWTYSDSSVYPEATLGADQSITIVIAQDTTYMLWEADSGPHVITKWFGTTFNVVSDTIPGFNASFPQAGCLNYTGVARAEFVVLIDSTSSDIGVVSDNPIDNSTNWTHTSNYVAVPKMCVPAYNGILMINSALNMVLLDYQNAFHTCGTSVFPAWEGTSASNNFALVSNSYDDSLIAMAAEVGDTSIWVITGRIDGASSYAWEAQDTTVILTSAPTGDALQQKVNPNLSVLGTDLYLFYLNWADPSGHPYNKAIVYQKSTDWGATWGGQTTLRASAGSDVDSIQCLTSPPFLYNNELVVAWQDSLNSTTGGDMVMMYIDTAAAAGGAYRGSVIITGGN